MHSASHPPSRFARHDPAGTDEALEAPSKSSRKREMQALQDIGQQLVELSPERLKKVPLPESLYEAVRAAQRFKMEARRRQLQYIGKLMRHVDTAPILAQLDVFNGNSAVEIARQHRLERMRADLIEDERFIGTLAATWPGLDLQYLRTLRRNALKEREAGKPPKAFREIFRVLRDLEAGQAVDADADAGEVEDDETRSEGEV